MRLVRVLAGVAAVLLAAGLWLGLGPSPPPVDGASLPLLVEAAAPLSLLDDSVSLTVGALESAAEGEELLVRVLGPVNAVSVGDVERASAEAAVASQEVLTGWNASEEGVRIALGAERLPHPGAYLAVVELRSGGRTTAAGTAWFGRMVERDRPSEVAFVWSLGLGIHRDSSGVFIDSRLEEALRSESEEGGIWPLVRLAERAPTWHFTLDVEPILLSQLADMADGFSKYDLHGQLVSVPSSAQEAVAAAQALEELKGLGSIDSIGVLAGTYAGASLDPLLSEGWWDGVEQLQLGKQELARGLGTDRSLVGALLVDPELSSKAVATYGRAFIDHVIVPSTVGEELDEEPPLGSVTARIRTKESQRLTLIFANDRLRRFTASPWDASLTLAGIASELASGEWEALVITPAADYQSPPAEYLEDLGKALGDIRSIKTVTVDELLDAHPAGTRAILLDHEASPRQGYIQQGLLESLRSAHQAVSALSSAALGSPDAVENAVRLLYTAESRWWFRSEASPDIANIGLAYAEQAQTLANAEFDKVTIGELSSEGSGLELTVTLTADNATGYPLRADVSLEGAGLVFPGGAQTSLVLAPGKSTFGLRVGLEGDTSRSVTARLSVGGRVLDQVTGTLIVSKSSPLARLLPWIGAGVVLIGGAGCLVFLLRRRVLSQK